MLRWNFTFNFKICFVHKYNSYKFIPVSRRWKLALSCKPHVNEITALRLVVPTFFATSRTNSATTDRMANSVFQLALFWTYAKRDFASINGRLANAAANQIETGRANLSISHAAAVSVFFLSLDEYFVRERTGRVLLKYASCVVLLLAN